MKARPGPLALVRAQNSLLNLFSEYLPLSVHVIDPQDRGTWYSLAPAQGGLHPVQFEIYFKAVQARYSFHRRLIARALREKKATEGEHLGIWDCFAPAGSAVLVSGAYLQALPEAAELRRRFAKIKGRAGASEELFLSYARSVLETPLLTPAARLAFKAACAFAARCFIEGKPSDAAELEALKPILARELPVRMERFAESRREKLLLWAAQSKGLADWDKRDFGVRQMPGAVMALSLSLTPRDACEGLVLAARLRRLAFEWALERGLICGRSAGEGACLLAPATAALDSLARAAQSELSRRLGAQVSLGLSKSLRGEQLPEAFRQGEWALLMALQRGERLLKYQGEGIGSAASLGAWEAGRRLKSALLAGNRAELALARDAALGSMSRLFPGRADLLRPQLLQLSLELFEAIRSRGLLEGPAWEALRRDALASLEQAGGARELAAEFSAIVSRLEQSSVSPRLGAARGRLKSAQRSLAEEAAFQDLKAAAAATGVSGSRFSRLFKSETGEGFASFRRRQRLDQAALLLSQAEMPVWRVAQECGYRSPSHFVQAFQRQFGKSPGAWRKHAGK